MVICFDNCRKLIHLPQPIRKTLCVRKLILVETVVITYQGLDLGVPNQVDLIQANFVSLILVKTFVSSSPGKHVSYVWTLHLWIVKKDVNCLWQTPENILETHLKPVGTPRTA